MDKSAHSIFQNVLINFMAQRINFPLEKPRFAPMSGKYFWTSTWFLATVGIRVSWKMVLGHGYQISVRGSNLEGYLQETSVIACVYETITAFVAKLQKQQTSFVCHWSTGYVRALYRQKEALLGGGVFRVFMGKYLGRKVREWKKSIWAFPKKGFVERKWRGRSRPEREEKTDYIYA